MQLTIKDKTHQIKFGIKFVRELDKRHQMARDGIEFGAGLEITAPMLLTKKLTTLADYLYLGISTESPRPSQKDIDDYLDSCEDIEALFDEVIEELEQSNASKLFMAQIKADLQTKA